MAHQSSASVFWSLRLKRPAWGDGPRLAEGGLQPLWQLLLPASLSHPQMFVQGRASGFWFHTDDSDKPGNPQALSGIFEDVHH